MPKKPKGKAMNLEEFLGGSAPRHEILPSAPTGEDRPRGGYRGGRGGRGGGGGRYGDRGGDRGGDRYGDRGGDRGGGFDRDDSRADGSDNWRRGGRGGGYGGRSSRGGFGDRGGDRGGFDRGDRGGGFGDRGGGEERSFSRNDFGTRRTDGPVRGAGGGRMNRDRERPGLDDDTGFSRSNFGTAAPRRPQGGMRQGPPGGPFDSSRAEEGNWRGPRKEPPRREMPPRRERRDDGPADDRPIGRDIFGTARPSPPRQERAFRDRDRAPARSSPADDGEWRRSKPLQPSRPAPSRPRDRDMGGGDRDFGNSWRRDPNSAPPPRNNDTGFGRSGFGRSRFNRGGGDDTGFGRTSDNNDTGFGRTDGGGRRFGRQDVREMEERAPEPPKAITINARSHQWNRPAAKASPVEPNAGAARHTAAAQQPRQPTNLKFGGSGQGWGAELGAELAATLEKSVEFNSARTDFGQTRLTFQTPTLPDDSPPPASNKPDFPSLQAKKARVQVTILTPAERKMKREEDERKKREKAEEMRRKKEEIQAKKKLKAERQAQVKECLRKGSNNFQGPLNMATIQTGTLELEFPKEDEVKDGLDRKKFLKYLSLTLVNSIVSKDHDTSYPRVLKMIEKHKTFESDDKFDVLHMVLYHLEKKVGEHEALAIIGNHHKRTLEALECNPEDPRDNLEDLSLLYLAPGIDVEALIEKAIKADGGPVELMTALNKTEGQVSPVLAEKVASRIAERLFEAALAKGESPAALIDEPTVLASKELLQTIKPVDWFNLFVLAWFEKAPKTDLKGALKAFVEKEVLQKQWLLDYQDDVCSSRYRKSKQKSLIKLTSWFSEIDLELNPPPSESEEDEDNEEDAE